MLKINNFSVYGKILCNKKLQVFLIIQIDIKDRSANQATKYSQLSRNLRKCYETQKPESQNFLNPGLAKPQSQLNLWFKNTDLGLTQQNINNSKPSFDF